MMELRPVLQRTVQHLVGPRTEAVGAPGRLDAPPDLSKFYRANGQHTPGPEDEPEPHGAPMDASISAAPHVFGFDAGLILSLEEIQSFKTNGFLVKRGFLPHPKVSAAQEAVWDILEGAPLDEVPDTLQLPPTGVSRADRATWMDAHTRWPAPDLLGQAIATNQPHASTTWRSAVSLTGTPYESPDGNAQRAPSARSSSSPSWQICALGSQAWMLDLLPQDKGVRHVATQLLGRLRRSHRARGIYAVFPTSTPPHPLAPHTDRVCQQLNVATYLEDVPPGGGGFTVWPGSHLILSKGHTSQSNWSPNLEFRPLLNLVKCTIQPVELCGKPGDVIFWHGRLAHSVGRHSGDEVRIAAFADFQQDRSVLDDEAHQFLGQYEWWHTASALFQRDRPSSDGVWAGWPI